MVTIQSDPPGISANGDNPALSTCDVVEVVIARPNRHVLLACLLMCEVNLFSHIILAMWKSSLIYLWSWWGDKNAILLACGLGGEVCQSSLNTFDLVDVKSVVVLSICGLDCMWHSSLIHIWSWRCITIKSFPHMTLVRWQSSLSSCDRGEVVIAQPNFPLWPRCWVVTNQPNPCVT